MLEAAVLSIAGHVSRKRVDHYSHVRMEAKRKALDGLIPIVTVAVLIVYESYLRRTLARAWHRDT
jgi:hypothetical protein